MSQSDTIARLQSENARLQRENARLGADKAQLATRVAQLEKHLRERDAEIRRLRALLDARERARQRQAAPFARDGLLKEPKKPGRKPGGQRVRRKPPDRIDRTFEAKLPCCPDCGCAVPTETVHQQYQIDIPPVTPIVTQFNVHVGHCPDCGQRVQGRHPEQTSDALGAAGVQIGPALLTMAAELKHRLGVTYRKIAAFYSSYFDVKIAPATFCRSGQRLAAKAKPTYDLLVDALQRAGVVHGDETGWRVGRLNAWLWVFCTRDITIYAIRVGKRSRSADVPQELLGSDFNGILVVDGLGAYDVLQCQKGRCNAHLLRRAHKLQEGAAPNDVRYLQRLIAIVQDAIALVDTTEPISERKYWQRVRDLETRLDDWLSFYGYRPSREMHTFAKHIRKHRDEWFRFLHEPEVEPTNNHAERMIRPAVIIRRIGACNRTPNGATTHEVLASLMATWHMRGHEFRDLAMQLWRASQPEAVSPPPPKHATAPAAANA